MRACKRCGTVTSDYPRFDLNSGTCRVCKQADTRDRMRALYQRDPAAANAKRSEWHRRNRGRYAIATRASAEVQKALARGQLVRAERCEDCGRDGYTEAAHSDYSRPLVIRWLCRSCHRAWDRADPKTLRPAADPASAEQVAA